MVQALASRVSLSLGVLALHVFLQACQPPEPDPEPHRIVGIWSQSSYKLQVDVDSGKSLIDFFKDRGLADSVAAFMAHSMVVPFEDNSLQTLEFRTDSTYEAKTGSGGGEGKWRLSEDEKTVTFILSPTIVYTASIEKLTVNELDLVMTLVPFPGLTRREGYSFVKK